MQSFNATQQTRMILGAIIQTSNCTEAVTRCSKIKPLISLLSQHLRQLILLFARKLWRPESMVRWTPRCLEIYSDDVAFPAVVCEKPFTMNSKEAASLIALADDKKLVLTVFHSMWQNLCTELFGIQGLNLLRPLNDSASVVRSI